MRELSEETRKKMSESAKIRCTTEWRKQKSEAYSTQLNLETVESLYNSGHTQAEIADILGTTQKVVWRFMRNHGIKARVAA